MQRHRHQLPQLGHRLFLTDGGLETTLIFHDRISLPDFAAFALLKQPAGEQHLRHYYERYAGIARDQGLGMVLEAPTWRASADWGARLGHDAAALEALNRRSIRMLEEVRAEFATQDRPMVISGNLGPRGDGYIAGTRMSVKEARAYHAPQVETFADTGADMVAVFTMNYPEEAIGVAQAARAAGMPVAVSFTVETDGRLPSGESLEEAIARTDDETAGHPAYYMINCAHPSHFHQVLAEGGDWRLRIRGVRANASRRSHAELDGSPDLDAGNPEELGSEYRELRTLLPALTVVGGCCGTDHRHVASMCSALRSSIQAH